MKSYSVLVEAEAWVTVEAESDREAEIKAEEEVLEHNPFGWDRMTKTVMNEEEIEE